MEPTNPQFPISHVKVVPKSSGSDNVRHMKRDAFGNTDDMRQSESKVKELYAEHSNKFDIKHTVKINGADY